MISTNKDIWKTMQLGEVIKLEYGKPLPDIKRKTDGIYPVYGANGEKARTDEYYHNQKTIIVGRKGSAGEINFTEEKFWPLDVTYFVTFDRDKHDLNFIYYLLTCLELPKLAKGVKPGINRNDVYSIPVKIPKLNEQQRIIAILDKAFLAIDNAKEKVKQNYKNAKNIFETYLQEIFEKKGEGIKERKFEEICSLVGGSQPSKKEFIYKSKKGYIRLIQVRDYRTDKYITYIPESKAKRFCTENDIMIGRYGPPIFGIFKGLAGAYNVALMKAEINTTICNSDYFYWFLKTKKLLTFVETSSKRAAGQDGIRKELLDKYPVPIPPRENQIKIVDRLNTILDKTKKLELIYQKKNDKLKELKNSILQKAFSGELTQIESIMEENL